MASTKTIANPSRLEERTKTQAFLSRVKMDYLVIGDFLFFLTKSWKLYKIY